MVLTATDIEDVALKLPEEDRARLALRLLTSLEEEVESPEAMQDLWIAEARRRFEELRVGRVQSIPADEVFSRLRAKLSP